MDCKNFRKPNVSSADPRHGEFVPTLTSLWKTSSSEASCEFVLARSTYPPDQSTTDQEGNIT